MYVNYKTLMYLILNLNAHTKCATSPTPSHIIKKYIYSKLKILNFGEQSHVVIQLMIRNKQTKKMHNKYCLIKIALLKGEEISFFVLTEIFPSRRKSV